MAATRLLALRPGRALQGTGLPVVGLHANHPADVILSFSFSFLKILFTLRLYFAVYNMHFFAQVFEGKIRMHIMHVIRG